LFGHEEEKGVQVKVEIRRWRFEDGDSKVEIRRWRFEKYLVSPFFMRWVWAHRTLEPADELLLHELLFAWRVVKKSQSKELTLRDKCKSGLYETRVKRCEIGIVIDIELLAARVLRFTRRWPRFVPNAS